MSFELASSICVPIPDSDSEGSASTFMLLILIFSTSSFTVSLFDDIEDLGEIGLDFLAAFGVDLDPGDWSIFLFAVSFLVSGVKVKFFVKRLKKKTI